MRTSASSSAASSTKAASSASGSLELTPEGADLPGALVSGYDTSTVRLDPSGKVVVLTGVTSRGEATTPVSHRSSPTSSAWNQEGMRVLQGDTGMCPYGFGHGSGRSMVVVGIGGARGA